VSRKRLCNDEIWFRSAELLEAIKRERERSIDREEKEEKEDR
jgi:hypothetical protein